ncbi:MAG TPA: hypothetical protein VE994_15765 [Terriglobales bacterium]|nr:hypothetical protein [Terriglobales bacterium]
MERIRASARALVIAGVLAILSAPADAQKLTPTAERAPVNRADSESFDDFLDAHPNIARVLKRNPALVVNEDFLNNHPELDEFLKNHPGAGEELREHPAIFIHREERFAAAGEHVSRYELDTFDHLLDMHREAAAELRSNPALVDDHSFLLHHTDLREFFEDHPHVRENLKRNPWAFVNWTLPEPQQHEQPVVYRPK